MSLCKQRQRLKCRSKHTTTDGNPFEAKGEWTVFVSIEKKTKQTNKNNDSSKSAVKINKRNNSANKSITGEQLFFCDTVTISVGSDMVLHCSVTVYRVCRSVGYTVEDSEMTQTHNVTSAHNIHSRIAALTGQCKSTLHITQLLLFVPLQDELDIW